MRRINLIRKDILVFSLATLIFLIPVLGFEQSVLQHTNGVYTLPSDDAYLNLTIPKNLAFFKVWGLSKYEFAPASSSLLFPLVLAVGFFLFGSKLLIVFIINTLLGMVCLRVIQRWLIRQEFGPLAQFFILAAVILLTLMPPAVVAGTEGILALLCCFLFVTPLQADWGKNHFSWKLYLFAALLVATQYQAMILVAAVCLFLLPYRKSLSVAQRGRSALLLAGSAMLPILVFGIISFSKGGRLIPPRLWMTTSTPYLRFGWAIEILIAFGLPLLISNSSKFITLRKRFPKWTVAILAIVALSLLSVPGTGAFQNASRTSIQVYERNWLPAKFALRYYNKYAVAARDIGMVSWLTEGEKLDLSRNDARITPDSTYQLGEEKSVRLAIVDSSYMTNLSDHWKKVADWELGTNITGSNDKICFYTADSFAIDMLKKSLQEYQFLLPKKVAVTYY